MAKAAVTRSIRDDHQKNFLKIFNGLTGKHSRWEIWEDFVTLTAIEISNSTDKDQLAALTNYMFELRRNFVTQLSTAECKKHLGEIVRFAVDAFDSNYDGELTIKLLGVAPPETDGVDLLDYLESTSVFSDQPEKALLSLAYSAADDGSNGYWGWVWKPDYQSGGYGWEENGSLDAIYTLLVALGYEMSDEEKALQNGTHAIFSTNAPKKADAPCDRCKAAHPNCDKCCKACDEPCNAAQACKKDEERTENND